MRKPLRTVSVAALIGSAVLAAPDPSFAQRRGPGPDEDAAVGAAVGAAILGGVVGGLLASGGRGHRGGAEVVRGVGREVGGEPFERGGKGGKGGRGGKHRMP